MRYQDKSSRMQRSRLAALVISVLIVLLLSGLYINMLYASHMLGLYSQNEGTESPLNKSVLVFYFPQFYEFEENNRFWGKGFTDHTNLLKVRRNRFGQPVIRPAERNGMGLWAYNQAWESHRRFQGKLASRYGIDGFVIMHYWFDDHAVMDAPLQGRLKDGEPGIPFCILWANEHWTKKWDGLDGSEMLLRQTYNQSTWIQHLEYLLPFFMDPGYIKVDGKPLFAVYRASDIPDFPRMLGIWDAYMRTATDFPGMHVVQILGSKWTHASHDLAPGAAGFIEYYPNLFNGGQWPVSRMLSTAEPNPQALHYYGVVAGWDNTPRHLTDGRAFAFPNHPSIFQYALQQNLARTKAGGFVFVNAWNEWGEGAAIEPSIEWGRRWLEAVQQAKANAKMGIFSDLDSQGRPMTVKLPPAGVAKTLGPTHSGCIIVRSCEEHEAAMFNVHQFVSTLQSLNTRSWDAFFVNTGATPCSNLEATLNSYRDNRLHLASPASSAARTDVPKVSDYHVDLAISAHCDPSKHSWLMVTNADSWYTPDALDLLPVKSDIVLMNFYGRYTKNNELRFGNGTDFDNCCKRLYDNICFNASPKVGLVHLGGAVLNFAKYARLGINFMQFKEACGEGSCEDEALIQALVDEHGWSYSNHGIDVCSFYLNASPQSCAIVGGVYFDSLNNGQAGCYELTSLPLQWEDVNWDAFVKSKAACICERYDAFSQVFKDP